MTKNRDVYGVKINDPFSNPKQSYGFEATTNPMHYEQSTTAQAKTETFYKEEFKVDSVVQSVIDEHIARAQMGKIKYNNTLDRTDLSVIDYLQHAKEEAMDLALYLEKTIQMLKGKK